MINNNDLIINGIIGFIIGDALGVPLEFKERNSYEKVIDMVGYGTYNLPKGYWSDDSSMLIATIKSIIDKNGIDYVDIMNNFMKWAYENEFTPNNKAFDIGNTTSKALRNYYYKDEFKICENPLKCGVDDINDNGNGSLMRILPIAYYCYYKKLNDDEIYDLVKNISSLTHKHNISILGCFIYSLFAIKLLSGDEKKNAYKYIREYDYSKYFDKKIINYYTKIIDKDISKEKIDNINSSGYIVSTLESVIWCLMNNNSYYNCVIEAINLGNDTDTIGALVGGLSGIYYKNLPKEWLNELMRKDYLINLCDKFRKCLK